MTESAILCWRRGILPSLSTAGLLALKDALEHDDVALIHGATTAPPPIQCMTECTVEGACPIGYAAWKGEGLGTVGQVEERFAEICCDADRRLGEPSGCRWFINAWDDLPRAEIRQALLAEILVDLTARGMAMPGEPEAA